MIRTRERVRAWRYVDQSAGDGSLSDVIASAVMDLDATIAASYPGTGTTWANLIAAPADGAAQTAYDFYTGDGSTSTTYPTFNGSAGDPAAYWSFDGGDYFNLKSGANTAFLNALHKTTGGSDWWAALTAYFPIDNIVDGLFTTQGAGSTTVGVRGLMNGSENIASIQRGDSAQVAVTGTEFIPLTTPAIIIMSHSHLENNTRLWANTATAQTIAQTYITTTSNAAAPLSLARAFQGGTDFPFVSTARMYSFAMGNEYLDNTKAAAIIAALEARHGRDYTP